MCLLAWMDVCWRAANSTVSAFPICVFLCLIFVESVLVILAIWLIWYLWLVFSFFLQILGFFSSAWFCLSASRWPVCHLHRAHCLYLVCLSLYTWSCAQILPVAGIPWLVRFLDANVLPHLLFFYINFFTMKSDTACTKWTKQTDQLFYFFFT